MNNEIKLLFGSSFMLSIAVSALVVLPFTEFSKIEAPKGLRQYTQQELRGRQVYIENECMACHSQQPRSRSQAPDFERGWGRAPVAADYYYDKPVLLGTMRTGPDLFNIAARQPSQDWQLGHLYQPRAYAAESIMPNFQHLFVLKEHAETHDKIVNLPPAYAPRQGVVVAGQQALDLVAYLMALDHTYPVDDAPTIGQIPASLPSASK
ncbi:cbb3-type cytochrome c oxidase subunit II [Undibacterium jejuense]|uniref:Cbb3-type cytochrome c oxidase subunit II n=1 Tax=Undibacterium jejuense TaxID=1344949 RepID=A0A923KN57_9BURK|nr:cbb3-type cytochrome c oxidase subunit II [Undibacterium jejuense]MBC3861523.1 cbb3-type cytochrome c oxidase subunit II [Undibacterium jejuense]